jgi:hypothetical protein
MEGQQGQAQGCMDGEELPACPCCGGEAEAFDIGIKGAPDWFVRCADDECGVSTLLVTKDTREEAVAIWTRRAGMKQNYERSKGPGLVSFGPKRCGKCGSQSVRPRPFDSAVVCAVCGAVTEA